MSNTHVRNFEEALVFARECDIDTTRLEEDAAVIVGEFLIANALAVQNYDKGSGEGSAAFRLGLLLTGMENDFGAFVSLSAHAYRVGKEYAC
jgi:hypothetical protein